ncbi:ras guanyl-nucleotide exchange factor [Cryptococcus neoformans]|nr:ras guanyl-nucleotide exchange factor [Cryptococcus neoformans var. grubii]OXC66415.1 ras guanyl-nucleotide exchange factor [Cryptococcus neoformans var. grubii MW-RSA852]
MTDPLCLISQISIMYRPNAKQLILDHLSPPTPSELISPVTPSPMTPASFHTATADTPDTLARVISEEDDGSRYSSMGPNVLPIALPGYQHSMSYPGPSQELNPDPTQAALLQSASLKLSSKDQEAMRKIRSTMMEQNFSDSASSNSVSSSSPRFPQTSAAGPCEGRELITRRSTLSKVVVTERQGDSGEDEDVERLETMKRWQSQPALSREGHCMTNFLSTPAYSVDYAIAVVGHEGVGKTTVIAEALRGWGMSNPVEIYSREGGLISSCCSQIAAGGKLKTDCKVELFEMGISALDLTPGAASIWPSSALKVSGAVCCYDAGRKETLKRLENCIEQLSATSTPIVILACKSDPNAELQIDAAHGNSMGEPYNAGLIEVTTKTHEGKFKMRNAVRWLLYKLEQRQRRQQRQLSALNIAGSLQVPTSVGSIAVTMPAVGSLASPDSDVDSAGNKLMWKQNLSIISKASEAPFTGQDPRVEEEILEDKKSTSYDAVKLVGLGKEKNMNDGSLGCLDHSEESTGPDKKRTGRVQAKHDTIADQIAHGISPVYVALKDLLNQFFTSIVSSEGEAFTRSFLLTYRRFCRPQDLMLEFLERFREVEDYAVSSDVKNWTLLKLTGALVDWTQPVPWRLRVNVDSNHV